MYNLDKTFLAKQTKVLKAYVKTSIEKLVVTLPTKDEVSAKQDKLTFDETPTAESKNPITSAGVKEYVDSRVSTIPKLSFSVVEELPTQDIKEDVIYLLKNPKEETANVYIEYLYVDGAWEILGEQTMDLSGYVKKEDFVDITDEDLQEIWGEDVVVADIIKY